MKTSKLTKIGGMGFSVLVLTAMINLQAVKSFADDRYMDLQLFAKVLNYIQQYYVEEVDTKKLIYGGIKGMLKELDPHTNFLPPEIYKEFESETSGEFGGLGIEITIQDGILTIISPIEDTPAYQAGLKSGDKIVEVNGESTKGLSLVEAAQKMKGKTGSTVKLGIYRDGFDAPQVFSIKRGTVRIRSVKYTNLEGGYAYLRLTSFIENTTKDLREFIDSHKKKHKDLKGMIIDLRRNPGGLLDQAVQISDLFLESGVIVSTIGRNKKEKEVLYAKKPGTYDNFPIVVIIDEYSASASEILAGALQDNKRALIMGQRSFGKGSVQSVVKLGDGSGLKLTVARYYTPIGRSIQSEGIVPDVLVENLSQEVLEKAKVKQRVQREKDIKGHLLGENEEESKQKKNTSKRALEFWWAKDSSSSKEAESSQQKLLAEDFQVLQAFSYLKAWDKIQGFSTPPAPPKQD
jgi:carboxyl-terminal processing protease